MKVSDVNVIPVPDAQFAAKFFIDYYDEVNGDISAYIRRNKLARMETHETPLMGFGPEDELFSDFSMHPNDMDIIIEEAPTAKFMRYLEIVSSHNNEASIPGKNLLALVREGNTGKILGMIRLGSPTINSKPRNAWLGETLDSSNAEMMSRFNRSVIMGFVIVPAQPFGFNYLGGKLLASIACSHWARDRMNAKYDIDVCGFETTSLYGSTKGASQYDGMRPFLRYIGDTESNFAPSVDASRYQYIHDWYREKIGGLLCLDSETSKKSKQFARMIRIINASLPNDCEIRAELKASMSAAVDMQEKKRTYLGNYGYSNVREYLTLKTDTLIPAENHDRYSLPSTIEWWKKKASKRYESLTNDGRLRTTLETWNTNPSDIDIIR